MNAESTKLRHDGRISRQRFGKAVQGSGFGLSEVTNAKKLIKNTRNVG
jgi:hypothetical protein